MKYLAFDIECADGGKATICSFGYVLANEQFEVIDRGDILMNPESRFELEGRVNRPDVKLWYSKARFERAPKFPHFHSRIKALLEREDVYVVGHSVADDVNYLNKRCARYRLEPFAFSYFDVQRFYSRVMGEANLLSLERQVKGLELPVDFKYHRSDEDAYATLLVLKGLLERSGTDFSQLILSDKSFTGRTEGFNAKWDMPASKSPSQRNKNEAGTRILKAGQENMILRGSENKLLFFRYLDEHFPDTENNLFDGKRVSISTNYEREHYKEMLHLVDVIRRNGGDYVLYSEQADVFVNFDKFFEDGTPCVCRRSEYVMEAIKAGAEIEIIDFDTLLALLGIAAEDLENAPMPDIRYLLDPKYRRKYRTAG